MALLYNLMADEKSKTEVAYPGPREKVDITGSITACGPG